MKVQNKVILICIAIALLIILGAAYFTDSWPGNGFFLMAGVIGMAGGAGYLLLGLILLLKKDKRYAYGLFTSAVVLIVLGFIVFNYLPQY